ncbi:MAG: hypothetical protein ACI4JS_06370 [Oscillospiraceae bacterium]
MKVSGYAVRLCYKPARLISDILSLVIVLFTFVNTHLLEERYPELLNPIFRADLVKLWVFPVLTLIPVAVYLVLILSNHRFEKYGVTADNAQSVYDWYAFTVSLCKLPILVLIADVMTIYQSRLIGGETSWFSIGYIFYALLLVIIIRFSMHRIRKLTEPPKSAEKSSEGIKVKVKVAEDKDNKDNNA